ncbi:MAG: translocation/assembly module TamB domain-containing protein [Burkholderiaceae bacterium]|nr:translocation/assembly module TamB domain-containing protein [Burkholderiaceae bacterium]
MAAVPAARTPSGIGSRAWALRVLVRVLRGLAWVLGLAVIALVLLTAGLWWWSGQDGSLATALRLAARYTPVQAEDVQGPLRGNGRIARLAWQQDGLAVRAEGVEIAWQPLGLLLGQFQLDRLAAASIAIDDARPPGNEPAAAPTSLGLPLRVSVGDIAIGRVAYNGNAFEAGPIEGDYGFDGFYHALTLRQLQIAQGRYAGNLRLGAYASMPLTLRATGELQTEVPGGGALPVFIEAQASGPLATLDIEAQLRTATVAGAEAAPAGAASAPAASPPTTPAPATPQARLQARVLPFAPQPVQQAQAAFQQLDLAALWPGAPRTRLSGDAHLRPEGERNDAWTLAATIDNAEPGPIDRQRVPLSRLQAEGEWRSGVALVRSLAAQVAGGEITAQGEWTDAATSRWTLQARARGIDPGQISSQLAAQPLDGQASVQGQGNDIDFDATVTATVTAAVGTRVAAPARRVRGSTVDLRPLRLQDASAKGRWAGSQLTLQTLRVRANDARLDATRVVLPLPVTGASGRVDFSAPGLTLSADGEMRETRGAGTLDLAATDTALALAWLRQLPGLADLAAGIQARGNARLRASWQGGWRDPSVDARLAAPTLDIDLGAGPASAWQLRDAEATLQGRIAQAQLAVRARAAQGARKLDVRLGGQVGQPGYSTTRTPDWSRAAWQARIAELTAALEDPAVGAGTWRVATRAPVTIDWTPASPTTRLAVGAGEAVLTAPAPRRPAAQATDTPAVATPATPTSAAIVWEPVRWRPGELVTAGRIRGLPMAWIEPFAGEQMAGLGLSGTLVFDGSWDAVVGDTLRLQASVARSAGDISLRAEGAGGGSTRVAAGVREARLDVRNEGERLTATLRWDSERAGTANGHLATTLARNADGAWQWAEDAPLQGRLAAQLPRIGVWSVLAPPGWRLRGSLATDVVIAGTRSAPSLTGSLSADDLALRSVVDGIEFGNGRLRARLAGTRLVVDEFTLEGAGERGEGGTLTARGEGGWIDGKLQARLQAQVNRLRASIRTDRQVTVSGQLTAGMDGGSGELRGSLTVDRALIVLPEESKPELGSDVIVVRGATGAAGATAPAQTSARADAATTDARTLALDVKLDLGNEFRVQGMGIDTRVRGALDITGNTLANPRVNGTVRTFGGQYRAYGQRLDVAQGVLIFNGPPANPTLDVLALRANMLSDQKVGVQITGTALLPRVRLYASPDMPDAEKLSWLVLGRSSASGGAEAALLQQAALALLGSRGGGGMSGGLASALGLDELSVRGSSTNESGTTTQGAITLGKRFSRNFYAAYERSLSGALGTLYVFYDLSRRWTVRAQTGEQSAVDLIFTLSYD